tara:strand:+ start:12822 stop:12971 length:150 start_codon:yes stop_codon:yes gene_type:complete
MADNIIHQISFSVKDRVVTQTVAPSELGFTFDSTIHFFSEVNWFFSDNT